MPGLPTPENDQTRAMRAELAKWGPRYRRSRQRIYELAEQALEMGFSVEDVFRSSEGALVRATLRNIQHGQSIAQKPPGSHLRRWRDRQKANA